MSNFTIVQKANCIIWLAKYSDYDIVAKNFKAIFCQNPDDKVPIEQEILQWLKHFHETGNFDGTTNDANTQITADIHTTTYEKETGLLNFFGFKKIHECHPYKMHLTEELTDACILNRLAFAEKELNRIGEAKSLHNTWFAGEARFYTNGHVECHNMLYLDEDPGKSESVSARPRKGPFVTVFAAFNFNGIIGPYIIHGSADQHAYMLFLAKFTHELRQMHRLAKLKYEPIFMHDDNLLHDYAKEFLDLKFPSRWIGPGSCYAIWPNLSPDLHPLCFFLWGFIKNKVYAKPLDVTGVNELEHRIHRVFMEVMPEMLAAAIKAYKERLKLVVKKEGKLVDVHDQNEHVHVNPYMVNPEFEAFILHK